MLVEREYLDRDYLAEFAAFYGGCARDYENKCVRLHFFRDETPALGGASLKAFLGGSERVQRAWQRRYLGFAIIRPLVGAPFGRTVLPPFPDHGPHPRDMSPTREYEVHIGGVSLRITGLAWQQQDQAVSACATISLWSVLHSVAHREGLTIPTTVSLTEAATQFSLATGRPFPSKGLQLDQLANAIRGAGATPLLISGDLRLAGDAMPCFGYEKLAATMATLLRAGFPVLVAGAEGDARHAVCAVGFRASRGQAMGAPPDIAVADAGLDVLYIHNDNIGPAVRYRMVADLPTHGGVTAVRLVVDPAIAMGKDSYPDFVPSFLVAALPTKLRSSPEDLLKVGMIIANRFAVVAKHVPIEYSCLLTRQTRYLNETLAVAVQNDRRKLAQARWDVMNRFPALSRFLGVIRVTARGVPLADFLWDTTDSPANVWTAGLPESPVFGIVSFSAPADAFLQWQVDHGLFPDKPRVPVF